MEHFKIGNYEFHINPNRFGGQVSKVGDNVRTLDGTFISQPTGTLETYNLSSVFYQANSRFINERQFDNFLLEFHDGNFYAISLDEKKIIVYNKNFVETGDTIDITDISNDMLMDFDVVNNNGAIEFWIVAKGNPNYVFNVDYSGVITKTVSYATYLVPKSIQYVDGIWLLMNDDTIKKIATNGDVEKSIILPYTQSNFKGYKGMTSYNGYIVVALNTDTHLGAYHVDTEYGSIVNYFSPNKFFSSDDVTYDGSYYVFFNRGKKKIKYVQGNTVLLDLYELEKEYKTNGYLTMEDDLKNKIRVSVNNFNSERKQGFKQMYDVNLEVQKVNRGVK